MAEVHFRTHVLLKSIIGKDLITDDNLAVLELVKNSFDANSKSVDIVFENIVSNDDKLIKKVPTKRTSTILIRDTGKGMRTNDLTEKWLNIAYSEKKDKRKEFGRAIAGNKGVGRFSCDRLGEYLNIYTRPRNSGVINHLFIDWKRFEVEGDSELNIQDISLEINEIPINDFTNKTGHDLFEKGTLLEISKLREQWPHDKLISLKRQLEKLINPNQAFKSNSFAINLLAPEFATLDKQKKEDFSKVNGLITNRIFEKLNFRTSSIQAEISPAGDTITTVLKHKGNTIFTLVEKNTFTSLKDIKITIYYLNTYSKIYFARQTGIRLVDFGSISLFINGFRIPPYGDQGDDWLGMEARKGQGFSRYLGTRETVGRIEINDRDDVFKIISSRSGVVRNEEFEQLTASRSPYGFFFKTFRRLERFVVEGIAFDSSPEHALAIEEKITNAGDKWRESNEIYTEDALTKNKRILRVVNNIIDVRANDIVLLDINNDFVEHIVKEQVETSSKELDKILKDISNKELKPNEISTLINNIGSKLKELDQFSDTVTKQTGESVTNWNKKFDDLRELYEQKHKELGLEKAALELKLAKETAEKRRIAEEAEADRKRLEIELEAERKEKLFNKKLAGTDIKEIIGLQHHINRATDKIRVNIQNMLSGIGKGAQPTSLLKYLTRIDIENKMIASIVKFVTNANYNLKATEIDADLNRFVREYIDNVYKEYTVVKRSSTIKTINIASDDKPFLFRFRPLEIIIIIDNLFNNSLKAKASNVEVLLSSNDIAFELDFIDDGVGIPTENLPHIYNIGFTTTEGSGIGLYHIKQIVESYKGTIEVNDTSNKGTTFRINFPHYEA
jgi:signal transduction histidine kinase